MRHIVDMAQLQNIVFLQGKSPVMFCLWFPSEGGGRGGFYISLLFKKSNWLMNK